MTAMRRLARRIHAIRGLGSSKTLTPSLSPSRHFHRRPELNHRPFVHQIQSSAPQHQWLKSVSEDRGLNHFPAILVTLFGFGVVEIAHADASESPPETHLPPESASSHVDLEGYARKERQRIEELLKSKEVQYGSYPRFTVGVKGQKITVKFQVPPTCEIPLLIANLVSSLGVRVEGVGSGSDMILRACDSAVGWQLTLGRPNKVKETGAIQGHPDDADPQEGDLHIFIYRTTITSDKAEIEFLKQGSYSSKELEAFVSLLQLAGQKMLGRKAREDTTEKPSAEKSIASLETMGVRVYGLNEPDHGDSKEISWDNIAGYYQQKRTVEDTILLALRSPEIYDDIARGTRSKFETNRPRAILFEGPPGLNKHLKVSYMLANVTETIDGLRGLASNC